MRSGISFFRRVKAWRVLALALAIGASSPAKADFLDDLFGGGSDPAPAPAPRARPARAPRDNFSIRLKETRRAAAPKKIRDASDGDDRQYVAGSRPQKALLCATQSEPAGKIDDRAEEATAYLRDETLRAGDSIVTPGEIVVFKGGGGCPHASTDFVSVARAGLSKVKRNALAAVQQGLKSPRRGFALDDEAPASNVVSQANH